MLSRLAFNNSINMSSILIERVCLKGVRSISTIKEVPSSLSLYLNRCTLKQPKYSSQLDSYTHDELLYSLQSLPNTRLKGFNEKDLEILINNPDFDGKKLDSKEINVENEDTKKLLEELSMIIKENKLKDQLMWKELVNTIAINNKKYLEWNSLNGSINSIIKSENNEKYSIPITKSMDEIVELNDDENKNIIISDNITNAGIIPYLIYKYINNNNNNNRVLEINMNDKMTIEISLPTKDVNVKYKTKTTNMNRIINSNRGSGSNANNTSITENITRIIMNNNNLQRINKSNEIHFISFNNCNNIKSYLSKDLLQRCKLYSINNEDLNTFIKCMNRSESELKTKELYMENFLDISNQKLSLYSDIKSILSRRNRDLEYEVDHLNKQLKNIMEFITKNVEDKNVIGNAYEKIMKECNISRVLNVENLFTKQKNMCNSYDELISLSDRELEEIDAISFDNNENINSTKFERILKVLPKIPNLRSIEISKSDIIDPDLLEFDDYLKTNQNLERLKIVSHKLTFLSFSSLLTNINPHVKELSLYSDLYNEAVVLILNNHIPKLPNLERLELYGYKLSGAELEKVYANIDAYCPNMKYLALPYVKSLKNENNPAIGRYGIHNYEIGFTDAAITVPELNDLYDTHPNLQFNYLECIGLNNGNVKEFAQYMKINKSLTHLFITEGNINADNIDFLFDRIDKTKIEILSFKKCKFKSQELKRLCERIDEFENVDDLEIEECNLDINNLSILLEKLKNLKKIRRLNIAGLEINDDTIEALKKFKTISPAYESLVLGCDSINPDLLIDLLGSELFNKTKVLTFKKLDIKMYHAHKLFNTLDSMPKIEFVILDGCNISNDVMRQISELNLKYEIVAPKVKAKKNEWLTFILAVFGLSILTSVWDSLDEKARLKEKENGNNDRREVLPNNNDIHRIQNKNKNVKQLRDNENNDDGYDRVFLEGDNDDNDYKFYKNNSNSNRNDRYFIRNNYNNNDRRERNRLQDNYSSSYNDNYSDNDREEDNFTIDEYSGGSSPHGYNR